MAIFLVGARPKKVQIKTAIKKIYTNIVDYDHVSNWYMYLATLFLPPNQFELFSVVAFKRRRTTLKERVNQLSEFHFNKTKWIQLLRLWTKALQVVPSFHPWWENMENMEKMEDINQMTKNTPLMSYDSKHQICDSKHFILQHLWRWLNKS